jgi:hypothetical protein
VIYQLYNALTGEPTGEAMIGAANVILQTEVLLENTMLEIRATRADVEGCVTVSTSPIEIKVYDLTIMVSGNILMASVNEDDARSYQWYREGIMVLSGGNNRTLTVFDDANYSVVVETVDGCMLEYSMSKDNEVDPVDAEALSLRIFPNPVQDNLTLQFAGMEGEVRVRIVTITGEVVRDMNFTITDDSDFEQTISVDKLNSGIYMMQVVDSNNHTEVKRFIKK